MTSSRRNFLGGLPALGLATALPVQASSTVHVTAGRAAYPSVQRIPLESGWRFRLDSTGSHDPIVAAPEESGWQATTVPHTWQTMSGTPEYVGVAWYKIDFGAPRDWRDQSVRIELEAVFHTAQLWLNGVSVGEHIGKGYTVFECNLSAALLPGKRNTILVRVDNTPSNTMLPRLKSFDWANDGGIIRPVSLLVSPKVFIERIEIDSAPDLERKTAQVAIRAIIRNTLATEQSVLIHASVESQTTALSIYESDPATATVPALGTTVVALHVIHLNDPQLWHFDEPNLYSAMVLLQSGPLSHSFTDTFGIRRFEVRGTQFFLNGEPVRLMGVERMAGSNPELGMAETASWIESNHRDMKELNCVFSRVHWAQDKRVLDYCDRNGILMQEEVPAWGPDTFRETTHELQEQLEQNGREQLQEMIARDRNHPSIVSWGLCNEVDGKNPRSRAFARAMSVEARRLDPARLQTYASHTLGTHPEEDMAGEFDFISTNEYYGSWQPGNPKDVSDHIDRIRTAFPHKPIVVSEYGWCECQPIIPPGDEGRVKIIEGHTAVFRGVPEVAGAIYFDYNDYRTLVGDKGEGAFQQRVHGVVDLYSNRKPSFHVLGKQSSPIESLELQPSEPGSYVLHIVSRSTLPAYTLRGYRARWVAFGYDDLPMAGRMDSLPVIAPGTSLTLAAIFESAGLKRIAVDVLRPTGFSVASIQWQPG